MAESVKVIVRCRPMNNREKDMACKTVVSMDSDVCSCNIGNPRDNSAPNKSFTFDGVYPTNSTTEQIYIEIVYPLVESVLEGYNSTVFAYGQTGCGKSFTMQGVTDPSSQRGIIPRAFEHIFEAISLAEQTKYLVHASYLEIYNEEIRDLLGKDTRKRLTLKEHQDRGVHVPDLSKHPVQNVSDCERLMDIGWRNRATGATQMNADSSRSHSIFSVSLEMMTSSGVMEENIRRGKLNLVDLAGSERQTKTGATGERLKEATKINLSLSALGNVISALVDGKSKHIPYRDSKLTRLLQDSLGGNTKTLMVACVSPADNNYDETLSTLRYANRAKNICNQPIINQDPKDTMLMEYQEEIKKLRDLLETSGQPTVIANGHFEERERVRAEFEHQMSLMRQQYAAEQDSKLRLQGDLDQLKMRYEAEMARISGPRTPSQLIVDQALNSEAVRSGAQQEVLLRLQQLQETMVGGERANDRELKEKRMKKKKASERRLQALAGVLAKVDDDEGVVLKVYDDINQELVLKTEALRKNKAKVRALEREILDLQSEFENERTDYLETIRRQDRQLKLYQQIAEKLVPTLRKDCNYSNLEEVKGEAVWSDDADKWTLPEMCVVRTKLPPAAAIMALLPCGNAEPQRSNPSSGSSGKSSGGYSGRSENNATPLETENNEAAEKRRIEQRMQRCEREDIAGNYFKPKRAAELLNRAKQDATQAFTQWRGPGVADFSSRHKSTGSSVVTNNLNTSLNRDGLHLSLNALNLNTSMNLNNSWATQHGNAWVQGNGTSSSPDNLVTLRRPIRLEALPNADKRQPISKPRRAIKSQLNTMDVI